MRLYDILSLLAQKVEAVIPITRGGTGETTATEALSALGGVSIINLWDNPSPTSAFEAQTKAFDLSGYDWVAIRISKKVFICGFGTESMDYMVHTAARVYLNSRQVTVTRSNIVFGSNYEANFASSAQTSPSVTNGNNIPISIYGIRGIQ